MDNEKRERLDKAGAEWTQDHTMFLTKRAPVDVPLNLADWFPKEKLKDWVSLEVQNLDQTDHIVKAALEHPPETRPRIMLAVLALAYCTQVFRSGEIVQTCHAEPAFRDICGERAPFAEELEHFRRTHRTAVERVITQVLLRAIREKFNLAPDQVAPGLERNMQFRAEQRTDMARHLSTLE